MIDRISVRDLLWMQLLYREINDNFFDDLRKCFPDVFTTGIEKSSDLVHADDLGNMEKKRQIKEIKSYIRNSGRVMRSLISFEFKGRSEKKYRDRGLEKAYSDCDKKLTRSNFDQR